MAATQAQALRHVTRMQFGVEAASAMTVAEKMKTGVQVEDADDTTSTDD